MGKKTNRKSSLPRESMIKAKISPGLKRDKKMKAKDSSGRNTKNTKKPISFPLRGPNNGGL